MEIARPTFSAPVICIDNFFTPMEAHLLFNEWNNLTYKDATIFDGNRQKVLKSFRNNDVSDLDQQSTTMILMRNKIWTEECKALWHQNYTIFDVINYSTYQEGMLSRYGDGAFYEKHKDIRWDKITYRLVTIVYYLCKEPKQFTGGSLILWEGSNTLSIEPRFNRAVLFPCFVLHEVEKVTMKSEVWEDARFSLNFWIGFRS
jgi:Rps23 Pro-64 3,4-dihydroxylase Tpa1-like proline 4-hydroxylase